MAKVVISSDPPFAEIETAMKRVNHIMRVKRGEKDNVAVAQYANVAGGLQKVLADLRHAARERQVKPGDSHAASR